MKDLISARKAFFLAKEKLEKIYPENEASAIAHELLEFITGMNKIDRLVHKELVLNDEKSIFFSSAITLLLSGKPIQYITSKQWFLGSPFFVNNNVLIPRPETEELVQWVINDFSTPNNISILDIGTGSGCIPISLKKKLPLAKITSCDISSKALAVAQKNAADLNTNIQFKHLDFLDEKTWSEFVDFDVIISNPPYIPISEKESLDKNVRDFEPETALFVEDEDPFIFYRKIALFGRKHLKKNGSIYCEIHRDFSKELLVLFQNIVYKNIEQRKDMHGNDRMLKISF